jgi:Fe-S cluster assembly protein SufD
MTAVTEQIGNWLDAFSRQPESPFQALRTAAFQRFAQVGFPTTHDEEWRFTNVAAIARSSFATPAPAAAEVDA